MDHEQSMADFQKDKNGVFEGITRTTTTTETDSKLTSTIAT